MRRLAIDPRRPMSAPPIPDDVQRFVLLAIPSVPYLEALLLMRSAPHRRWNSSQVAQRLYLSDKVGAALLAELHAAGVADADANDAAAGNYQYQPQSDELTALIDRLAIIYAKNLVGVSTLIHSKMNKKAQRFVDAFVLRKES
ncbi:MAG: hypothetical protein M3R60_06090 [Pseudomonadota bacterium]|nr:hypothetical protein [Pseudomonadota bacterium]